METKKADHQVNIVRLGEPRVHTNADTLELFDIGGYQCVTKKGSFKTGDLAIYIQPDSVVPQTEAFRFIWEPFATPDSPAPEKRRRITVRRFRKEVSEGLLMPVEDFGYVDPNGYVMIGGELYKEGDDVSQMIGITHYEGDQDVESTEGKRSNPMRKYPRTLRGWFFWTLYKMGFRGVHSRLVKDMAFDVPKFDVDNFKNHSRVIEPGEEVIVTEKIHGSQARYVYKEGVMYAGSHKYWRAEDSKCVWRKSLAQNPWIEEWCRGHEGSPLYTEVVPTQGGYLYGCKPGEIRVFAFDARDAQNGMVYFPKTEFLRDLTREYANTVEAGIVRVPILYEGPYDLEKIKALVEGLSTVDGKTQREGIVITVKDPNRIARGIGRVQLKWKSNSFLEKEGNR
jgi:hypothetical protein